MLHGIFVTVLKLGSKPHVHYSHRRSSRGWQSGLVPNLNQMGEYIARLALMGSGSVLRLAKHSVDHVQAAAHASRSVIEAELLSLKVVVPRVPAVRWVDQPDLH
jgi:hypothetical protein